MSKESRIDEQIKGFYDNVPDVDDAFPLKEYLLKHEDSRMAWYLLGKQYEGKGDTAKATYCFAQAGDIYAAFEGKPAPELPAPKSNEKNGKKAFWIWTAVFTVMLGAIGFGLKAIMDKHNAEAVYAAEETPATDTAASHRPNGEVRAPSPAVQPFASSAAPGIVSAAASPKEDGHEALGDLLTDTSVTASKLLVKAANLGKWNDWLASGKPVASVTTDAKSGASGINWFDPKWCNCKPLDGKAAQKAVQSWKPAQEGKLALRSAMIRYREQKGKWPATAAALNGDYPDNTMAGWSEEMTAWFEELKAVLEDKMDGKLPKTVGWPSSSGPANSAALPAGQFGPMTEQPLEIIVDKSNHRLAVVSGDVLLRNYEVGLGGDRTPEGAFVITEKVRDPNGRSNGAFGSRGMTLSNGRYGIHGTDEPDSLGKDESLGCVRMSKQDIEELFDLVPVGTTVTIAQGGLPDEVRVPEQRFRLKNEKNETNPNKVYDWL